MFVEAIAVEYTIFELNKHIGFHALVVVIKSALK